MVVKAGAGADGHKIKKVPSDPRRSSLANLHARFEPVASGLPGALFRTAPRCRGLPDCASQRHVTPASLPARSRNLEADFHSPVTTPPLPESLDGVIAPALPLRSHAIITMSPVRSSLHPRYVSRTTRGLQQPAPVAHSTNDASRVRLQPSLPFRALQPFRIIVPDQRQLQKAYPSRTPDLPSLPAGALCERFTDGSSFGIRYVPSSSLFREPLGTKFNMLHFRRAVKEKMSFFGLLHRSLFPAESIR